MYGLDHLHCMRFVKKIANLDKIPKNILLLVTELIRTTILTFMNYFIFHLISEIKANFDKQFLQHI